MVVQRCWERNGHSGMNSTLRTPGHAEAVFFPIPKESFIDPVANKASLSIFSRPYCLCRILRFLPRRLSLKTRLTSLTSTSFSHLFSNPIYLVQLNYHCSIFIDRSATPTQTLPQTSISTTFLIVKCT